MQDYSKRKKQWNIKTRPDDKRGYKDWTDEAKLKVRQASMRHPQLNDKAWLEQQYIALGKTTVQIAKEVGCVNSTVFHALKVLKIPRKHNYKREKHHLWRGGGDFRTYTDYQDWRIKVFGRDNFTCQMCGDRGGTLNAHHVLPCRNFPDLVYDVNNGITLCWECHKKTFNCELKFVDTFNRSIRKSGELLKNPDRTISNQAEAGMPQKVQRLEDEARTAGNSSTSAVHESDDIVRS